MDARSWLNVAALLAISLPFAGCNSDTAENNTGRSAIAADKLAGTWYGRASVDSVKLQAWLDSIADPVERERHSGIVQGFLTTEMAARFDPSGTMELDMQMQPPGRPVLRDSTRGQWTVVQSGGDSVLIETVEQLPDGQTETSQVQYRFDPGGNKIRMTPPTSPWLAACDPVFVFTRIEGPRTDVASQPDERQIK